MLTIPLPGVVGHRSETALYDLPGLHGRAADPPHSIPLATLAAKLAAHAARRAEQAPPPPAATGVEPPLQGRPRAMDGEHVIDRLRELVAMDTSYERSNEAIVAYLQDALREYGFRFEVRQYRSEHDSCAKSLLIATRGQAEDVSLGMVVHTDGVPAGDWADAFNLAVKSDGRLVGRGTASNKGALAVLLDLAAQTDDPMQLFFSFNQEGGLTGIEHLIEEEPDFDWPEHMLVYGSTGLVPVSAAKGYGAYHAHFSEARGLLDFLCRLDDIQRLLQLEAYCDDRFDPPYGTLNVVFPDGAFGFTQVPAQASLTVCHAPTPQGEAARAIVLEAIQAAEAAEHGAVGIGYREVHDGYEITFSAAGGHGSIGGKDSAVGGMTRYWSHLQAGLAAAGLPADAVTPHFQANKPELLIEYRPLPFDTANALDLQLLIEKAMHASSAAGLGDNALVHLGHSEGFITAADDPLLLAVENIAQCGAIATSHGSEGAPLAAKRPSTVVIGHGLPQQRLHAVGEYTTVAELGHYFDLLARIVRQFADRASSGVFEPAAGQTAMPASAPATPAMVLVAGHAALPEARRLYGSAPMLVLLSFDPLSVTHVVEQLFVQADGHVRFDHPIPIVGSQNDEALQQWTEALHHELAGMAERDFGHYGGGLAVPADVFPSLAVEPQSNRYRHAPEHIELKAGGGLPSDWLASPEAGTMRQYLPVVPDAGLPELARSLRQSRLHFVFPENEWLAYLIATSRHGTQPALWEVLQEQQVFYEATYALICQLRTDSPSTPLDFSLIDPSSGTPLQVGSWSVAEEGDGRRFQHSDGSVAQLVEEAGRLRIRIDLRPAHLARACLTLDALCDFLDRRNVIAQHVDVLTSVDSDSLAADFAQVLALHGIAGEVDGVLPFPSAAGLRRVLSLSVQEVRDYYGDGTALSAASWRRQAWGWEPGKPEPCFWQCEDAWSFAERGNADTQVDMVVADRNRGERHWAAATIGATAQLAAHVHNAGINAGKLRIVTVSSTPQAPPLSALSTLLNTIDSPSMRHEVRLERMAIDPAAPPSLDRSIFTPYQVATPPVKGIGEVVMEADVRNAPALSGILVPTSYDPFERDTLAAVAQLAQEQGTPLLIMASRAATPQVLAEYFGRKGVDTRSIHVVYVPEGYHVPGLDLASSAVPIPVWNNDAPKKRRLGQLIALLCGWLDPGQALLLVDDDVTGMTARDIAMARRLLSNPSVKVAGWHFEGFDALPDHSFLMHLARMFAQKMAFIGEGAIMLRDFLLFLDMFSEGWLALLSRHDVVQVGAMTQKAEQAVLGHAATKAEAFADTLAESYGQWIGGVPREWLTDPLMWKIAIAQRKGLIDFLQDRLQAADDQILALYLLAHEPDERIGVLASELRQSAYRQLAEESATLEPDVWPQLMAKFMRAVFADFDRFPGWLKGFRERGGAPEDVLGIRFCTEGGFTRPATAPAPAG